MSQSPKLSVVRRWHRALGKGNVIPSSSRSLAALALVFLVATAAAAQDYNAAIVKYCQARVGKRVGAGECAHLATEALRAAGAEFTHTDANGQRIADSPKPGDYVWGQLIYKKEITDGRDTEDWRADKKARPGDIIQYGAARFASGPTIARHTAIVATVDKKRMPAEVYQQNVRTATLRPAKDRTDGRVVSRGPGFDIRGLRGGRVMIYRPIAPANPAPVQVTLTNNSDAAPLTYEYFGKATTLGGRNTQGGFRYIWGRGPGATTLTVDGDAYTIRHRKGYEFYTKSDGKIGLREVP
ncbi:MAG: amidase domain-containing protein [Gemmataceae bacterium]|nr:amidase domain-containing protein [Gemmataceae bacterium]